MVLQREAAGSGRVGRWVGGGAVQGSVAQACNCMAEQAGASLPQALPATSICARVIHTTGAHRLYSPHQHASRHLPAPAHLPALPHIVPLLRQEIEQAAAVPQVCIHTVCYLTLHPGHRPIPGPVPLANLLATAARALLPSSARLPPAAGQPLARRQRAQAAPWRLLASPCLGCWVPILVAGTRRLPCLLGDSAVGAHAGGGQRAQRAPAATLWKEVWGHGRRPCCACLLVPRGGVAAMRARSLCWRLLPRASRSPRFMPYTSPSATPRCCTCSRSWLISSSESMG